MSESTSPVVVLAGRPNAGKSTIYNLLTGGSAKVGNFPGITVDVLEGLIRFDGAKPGEVSAIDLPGFYAFSASMDAGSDEGIAQTFLQRIAQEKRRSLLIHVMDATQLAVSLPLLKQLRELHSHLAVIVTQLDLLKDHGDRFDPEVFCKQTGIAVIAVSARDEGIAARLKGFVAEQLQREVVHESPVDFEIDTVVQACVSRVATGPASTQGAAPTGRAPSRTEQLDRWLLHPVIGPALFLSALASVFAAVFLVADPAANLLEKLTRWLGSKITMVLGVGKLASFFVDGVLGGAGTVLGFLPQIVILTVALEALDGSGYLARGVFLLDRLLRGVGLGGRSLVPLLMGHACAVAAIPATRILRDPKERLLTIMVLPLMTCSARIPTYSLLISAFFSALGPFKQACIFVGLYLAGILSAALSAAVLRRTAIKGRALPLLIEIPVYRTPQRKALVAAGRRAARQFVGDVGKTIVAASALLWIVLNVPAPWTHATLGSNATASEIRTEALNNSLGAQVGHAMEPVTKYAGFDWRINVGLIGSFGARELMVGTMGVIMGIENAGEDQSSLRTRLREARTPQGRLAYNGASASALLVFFVLACQCMSTVAAVKRETRSWKWPIILLLYTYFLAFFAAVLVFQIGSRLA